MPSKGAAERAGTVSNFTSSVVVLRSLLSLDFIFYRKIDFVAGFFSEIILGCSLFYQTFKRSLKSVATRTESLSKSHVDTINNTYFHTLCRVKSGECYHMYSKARGMTFDHYPLPEMLRTRLEEVILQIKILQLGKAKEFLANVMDPPDLKAIDLSLDLLRTLNALDSDENLTPLGYHLAHLPLDPRTGNNYL